MKTSTQMGNPAKRTRTTLVYCAGAAMFLVLLPIAERQVHAQVSPLWDHYGVYLASPSPPAGPSVILEDQFGAWSYDAFELVGFSLPNEKTHGGTAYPINNPRLHYTWWSLGQEVFDRPGVEITNQFGTQQINVHGGNQYLVNPATKDDSGPIPIANHYKCYECDGTSPGASVVLEDQFLPRTVDVGSPSFLCNPAKKTIVGGPVYEIVDPDQHYVCYALSFTRGDSVHAVSDQFVQNWQLEIELNVLLCVPSLKATATPTKGRTWGRLKILYR